MTKHFSLLVLITLLVFKYSLAQTDLKHSFKIQSTVLNEERTCLVELPESYSISGGESYTYPVIILLDGSTFLETTSGIIRFMSSPKNRNYLMPEALVIAIENVDRRRDFTVTKIETQRGNSSGGGKNFLKFIETELIPHIQSNYRTEKHLTLIGHSLGGLLTLNSYMDENSAFDAFISLDPSIWWNPTQTKEKVEALSLSSFSKKLYIATANQGAEKYERNKQRHDLLYGLLTNNSSNPKFIRIHYFENEDHRSVPLKGIYEGLKFVFEDW